MTRATSGVLAGPSGWLRTRAPGETFYLDHRDCFWSLASSLGPDGQPMIAVDLFFDTLDLEEQFARKDAIPHFFAAGAVYLSGLNSKGIVESGELEPISSSKVQRTPEITVFRASDGAFEDSQCGVGRCLVRLPHRRQQPAPDIRGVSLRYEMVWECPRGDRR